jgi:thioredoxin 1
METIYYIILAVIALYVIVPVSRVCPIYVSFDFLTMLARLLHQPQLPRGGKSRLSLINIMSRLSHIPVAGWRTMASYSPSWQRTASQKVLFAPDRTPIPETSGNVYKITKAAELDALLSSTTNVVVDFYADWCPPCRMIAPIFSKLADSHAAGGRLAFAKVNVDHVNDVAKRYDVSAMPTFVFFEGGKPKPVAANGVQADRIRGADPKALTAVVLKLAEKAKADTEI